MEITKTPNIYTSIMLYSLMFKDSKIKPMPVAAVKMTKLFKTSIVPSFVLFLNASLILKLLICSVNLSDFDSVYMEAFLKVFIASKHKHGLSRLKFRICCGCRPKLPSAFDGDNVQMESLSYIQLSYGLSYP